MMKKLILLLIAVCLYSCNQEEVNIDSAQPKPMRTFIVEYESKIDTIYAETFGVAHYTSGGRSAKFFIGHDQVGYYNLGKKYERKIIIRILPE
jgi:hypothetical protein